MEKCNTSCFEAFVEEINKGIEPAASYKGKISNRYVHQINSKVLERLELTSLNGNGNNPRITIDCPKLKYLNVKGIDVTLVNFANNCAAKAKNGNVERCELHKNGLFCKKLL